MESRVCIISAILTLLCAEACTSHTLQSEELSEEDCGSKSVIAFSPDSGYCTEGGFSIIGISPDDGDIVINDVTLPESSPDMFITKSRHNISYGQSIDFYALYPQELDIGIQDDNVSFTYGPEHKGMDILAGGMKGFVYRGNTADNIVPIRFHHIMGGLEISVQGIDKDAEYIVRNLSARSAASAVYDLKNSRWDKKEWYDDTSLGTAGKRQYFIPGKVEITVHWSCTHNGIETAEYTVTVPVTLTMGMISKVRLCLSDSGSEETGFDVNVEPWDNTNAEADF